MTPRVKEILRNYEGNPPGVLTNLARLLMNGRMIHDIIFNWVLRRGAMPTRPH